MSLMMQETLFGDTPAEVRMLTIRQPWAWAIIHAGKDVENRPRYCSYRGRLLIHAAQTIDPAGAEELHRRGVDVPPEALQAGHIIGSVHVTGCTPSSPSPWARPGKWHLQLADAEPATQAVNARGQLAMGRPPEGWERAFQPVLTLIPALKHTLTRANPPIYEREMAGVPSATKTGGKLLRFQPVSAHSRDAPDITGRNPGQAYFSSLIRAAPGSKLWVCYENRTVFRSPGPAAESGRAGEGKTEVSHSAAPLCGGHPWVCSTARSSEHRIESANYVSLR